MWPYEDHFKVQRGRFVISNMDTSQGRGEHWLTFYFSKLGPYDFLTHWDTCGKSMRLDLRRS